MSGSAVKNGIYAILHTAGGATNIFVAYYALVHLRIPKRVPHQYFDPGQFKYLTFWNILLQAAFFLLCLANDFAGTNEVNPTKRPILRRIKDYVHATLGFPVAMFVGITFWALMMVDRELVLPSAIDPYFPSWLNHLMHTSIMIFTMLELIVAPRNYPSRISGLGGLLVFLIIYLVWLHIIFAKSGIWVYPVMEVLSTGLRIVFFVVLFLLSAVLYIGGEYLDRLIWGRAKKSTGKASKKKK